MIDTNDAIVTVNPYDMQDYDKQMERFFSIVSSQQDKLESALNFFLEKSYLFEALGEGPDAIYSQEPLYRTDKFDCVSYVDTVLSLYHANNLAEFKKNILRIRYANLVPHYIFRTDWFTDLEWIPHATQLGWIKEVTWNITDKNNQPIAKVASSLIDKPNWYKVKPLKAMHLFAPVPQKEQALLLLQELRSHYKQFNAQPSQLAYLPLDKLFDHHAEPDAYFFNQIPSGSVIAIVRPDWQIKDSFPGFPQGYGTNLNVSHLGIVIRTSEGLMFYHASSLDRKVLHEPLVQYLKKQMGNPAVKGIHVEVMGSGLSSLSLTLIP